MERGNDEDARYTSVLIGRCRNVICYAGVFLLGQLVTLATDLARWLGIAVCSDGGWVSDVGLGVAIGALTAAFAIMSYSSK